ncbi:lathosterol oxidase [Cryptococcus bacillisporus CA1873]|uniref:Lathosterol oxidase n=1 Tax=Cryptococcus bacillisporus CA1873 TaxID=1296111 RepID=A0ABR5BJ87_CRYGA|nr:lathosterol oxidase [Cryptococcus bacillisporus CA1873]|eukprot:KIR69237.1 lathosterol oxidase [Cryptococcus gattii CA1873]
MDILLEYTDEYVLDKVYNFLLPHPPVPSSLLSINTTVLPDSYPSSTTYYPSLASSSVLPRDSIIRQSISLFTIALLGAYALYFIFCSLSYYFVYDRRLEHHPKFLKDQKRKEIVSSVIAAPWIALMTLPWFVGEVRGYSMLYDNVTDYGWGYTVLSVLMFLLFTDFGIYWVHRIEHHPAIYKYIHKPHHKWIVPTPYAALAFHPVDGYAQSLPYHIFPFLFPLHKYVYLGLFVFVQFWTILIHDADMITGHMLERYINGPAHHTLHHLYFTCNYGQYFTWADQYFDSFRSPAPELDPIHDSLKMMKKKGLIDEAGNPIPQTKEAKKEQ